MHLNIFSPKNNNLKQTPNVKNNIILDGKLHFKTGKELFNQGKIRLAKREFKKMLNTKILESKTLSSKEFAEVGIMLTNPKTNKKEINVDFFACKFLEKADELGTNNGLAYERLAKLSYEKYAISMSPAEVLKMEDAALKMKLSGNANYQEVLTQVYSTRVYPAPKKAIKYAKELLKSDNAAERKMGEDILYYREMFKDWVGRKRHGHYQARNFRNR
jgi:hypothetical protein